MANTQEKVHGRLGSISGVEIREGKREPKVSHEETVVVKRDHSDWIDWRKIQIGPGRNGQSDHSGVGLKTFSTARVTA